MSNAATERMLAVVENARREARSAESDYEAMETRIQMKSSYSINLYGGTATNQVVEIASMARKACDDLYASYQMLVRMIDEECRPLLDQEPELRAVKEVKDLIVWLNDESEIEANFSASFNYNSLGNVASSKYVPTMENKMIQKYWENKYAMWPGRAEEEARERAEAEAKRKAQAEAAKKKAEEEQKQYEAEMAIYEEKVKIVEAERKKQTELFVLKTKKKLEEEALNKKNKAIEENKKLKEESLLAKAKAQATLASLGFFKFAEKNAAKQIIDECVDKILQADAALAAAPANYEKEMKEIPEKIKSRKAEFERELDKKYPMPKKPRKSLSSRYVANGGAMTAVQMANEGIKSAMMDMFEENPDRLYTITDIMENCPEAGDLSNQRVSALVRQLVTDGLVERTEERRLAYFKYAEQ